MTRAEIIGLLAEMILEDLRQPSISNEESPHLLEEVLRAYEYEVQWKLNSPITMPIANTPGNSYATNLPADLSVNDPAYPAEFRNAAGSAIIAGWSA